MAFPLVRPEPRTQVALLSVARGRTRLSWRLVGTARVPRAAPPFQAQGTPVTWDTGGTLRWLQGRARAPAGARPWVVSLSGPGMAVGTQSWASAAGLCIFLAPTWPPSGSQIFFGEMQECKLNGRLLSNLNFKHDLKLLFGDEKRGNVPGCGLPRGVTGTFRLLAEWLSSWPSP